MTPRMTKGSCFISNLWILSICSFLLSRILLSIHFFQHQTLLVIRSPREFLCFVRSSSFRETREISIKRRLNLWIFRLSRFFLYLRTLVSGICHVELSSKMLQLLRSCVSSDVCVALNTDEKD